MNDYVIFADSGCDISRGTLEKWGVKKLELTFMFGGDEKIYTNDDMSVRDFYHKMRQGAVAKTSALNTAQIAAALEAELKKGSDVLYITFSSGLSSTYSYACAAAQELREKYPDRKVVVADSLSASAGYGMLLYLTAKQRREGAGIEDAAKYAESTRVHQCHWFSVDDLMYLKRGGRISSTAAIVGSILGVKPILHMDDQGHLINVSKVRGRKASLHAIADKYGELAVDMTAPVFISHGDCKDDAKYLAHLVKERYGISVELIADIGPVIGAHSGPGTIALFFLGSRR